MAAPVVPPIADQVLTSNQSSEVVVVTAVDPEGQPVSYAAKAAGSAAYFLATDLALKADRRPVNWGKQGEKWFQGTGGFYFLKPTGDFHKWDGTANKAQGPLLATLPPVYFHGTALLTKPTDQDEASAVAKQLGLAHISTPIQNALGFGEKWLGGFAGAKYLITPDGSLYKAGGTPLGKTKTFLVKLDPAYFADTRLLTAAKPVRLDVSTSGALLNINKVAGAAGTFVVRSTVTDTDQDATSVNFQVTVGNAAAPAGPALDPQILAVGDSVITLPAAATDSDGDAVTYTTRAAGSEAFFLATDLGLKTGSRPVNWGKQGERWFQGDNGWFFLKPSGDLHQWDGVNRQASGPFLASLPPAFFYYPDLLTKPSDQDMAFVLDARLGLAPAAKPAANTLGLEEKWLAGTQAGSKFFVTPDGGLYRQLAGKIVWLADVGAGYYKQPAKLYAATRDRFAAGVNAAGQLTVTTKPNFIGGFAVQVTAADGVHTTKRVVPVTQSEYVSPGAPRVVGAIALDNRRMLVSFSQPMNSAALNPANYQVTRGGPGNAVLGTVTAKFANEDRTAVVLETQPQTDADYTVAVVNVKDLGGTALASPIVSQGVLVDPTRATFAGRPPGPADIRDTDGDGLPDHKELRGYEVIVELLNQSKAVRWVTSDPNAADTDGDGLGDAQEANLRTDPRDRDTDDDQLTDDQEFNELYTDPVDQDTDNDLLDEFLEYDFFNTSPFETDTDGDQVPDNLEVVLGARNPRVADVPKPGIKVGEVGLTLDVRYTAESTEGTRVLSSKTVSSSLQQTDSDEVVQTDAQSDEFVARVGYTQAWHASSGDQGSGASGEFVTDNTFSGNLSTSFTETSARETQKAVNQSAQSDVEATADESVTREVVGAEMKVALSITADTSVAFTVKNLQVTAFMADPARDGALVPVATLVPDAGMPNEFTVGPFVPERGPFIFASTQVFPAVVEKLMQNPRGLVFKIANYDLVDEAGRNYAFSSQDINDRTSPLVIDFGFGDADDGGPAGTTERYRVASNTGRYASDTNGDGVADENDRLVIFDRDTGASVGVTADDVLQNVVRLTKYDEAATPTGGLTNSQLFNSYSTRVVNGVEQLWRVRNVSREGNPLKFWAVFTSDGITTTTAFKDLVLTPDSGLTLKFIQDLDDDGIDALQEYKLGSSDTDATSDGDSLPDAVEHFGGVRNALEPRFYDVPWIVEVAGREPYQAFSSPARADTDGDGLTDDQEFNRLVDVDTNNDGTPDVFGIRKSLDPANPDTDGDGLTDAEEVNGYTYTLRFPAPNTSALVTRKSDPLDPDSDRDGLRDGAERDLQTDTLFDDAERVRDDDGDGLINYIEDDGWQIAVAGVSATPGFQGPVTNSTVTSAKNDPDTDDDGLTDREERALRLDPRAADTDGDGQPDLAELTVTANPTGPRTLALLYNPADADMDNDQRSDGDELNADLTVTIFGRTPYTVKTDPKVADADGDGLRDGEEAVLGTDPTKFDTDEDNPGVGDKREGQLGTNPLRRDQKVTVTFTSVQLKNFTKMDEAIDRVLEMNGSLLAGLNGSLETLVAFSADMANNDIISTPNASRTFILNEGDTIEVRANGFYDFDGGGIDDAYVDDVKTFTALFGDETDTLTNMASLTGGGVDGGTIGGSSIITSFNLRIVL